MDGLITGWAHTRFGKLEGQTVGGIFNMGGADVANCVSIRERRG